MKNDAFDQWLKETPDNTSQWMLDGLKMGLEFLNMESAIISRIKNREYVILQAASRLGDIFTTGDIYELSNTYCEAVVRQHRTISFNQAGNIPEMRLHPVYQKMHMESYIGTPIHNKEGAVIGTISFTAHEVRATDFSLEEISFVEKMSKKLAEIMC